MGFFLFPSFDCHIAGLLCNLPWMPLSPCRHQFTSGDCLSGESGCRPRWDRPHEHRRAAACVGVPPTRPGHHTGKFLCYLQLLMEDTESYVACCCWRTNSYQTLILVWPQELTSPRLIKSHLPHRFLPSALHNGEAKVSVVGQRSAECGSCSKTHPNNPRGSTETSWELLNAGFTLTF